MNELLVRTPDSDIIAEMADPFNEEVDRMVDEEEDDADIILNQSLNENPLTEAEMNAIEDPVTWTINVFGEGCKSTKVIQCKCGKPLAEGQVCSACKMSNK